MAQGFSQSYKKKVSVLVFLKGTLAPLVLYFDNPYDEYAELMEIVRTQGSIAKLIEKDTTGPIKKVAFLSNQINDGYNAKWNNDTQEFEAPVLQTNFSKGNLDVINMYDTFEVIKTSNKSALRTR